VRLYALVVFLLVVGLALLTLLPALMMLGHLR
jgi:hypothetical protein